jgi:hypothetical protein
MFLMGGAAFNGDSLAGGVSGSGEYRASDGTSPVPPPVRYDPETTNLDGTSPVPPPLTQ